jgi:alkyl sulfatase BDS1-like metallo-beta-lactamase superfamily hydrolase
MFNACLNAEEIADQLKMPAELDRHLHTHGYYGALRHNVRAVFQFYLSGFDGNPANLDTLPRAEVGKRLVALAGGADKAVAAAQGAFDRGDLRWAAQLLDGVLRAEPGHAAARNLLVRTYRQLGFAAEASTWRNFYLTGAQELLSGAPEKGVSRELVVDMLRHTPTERFLEAMAASVNGPKAEGLKLKINLVFSDTREAFVLQLDRSVMHHARVESPAVDAQATLTLTKPFFIGMMAGKAGAKELLMSDQTRIEGSALDLGRFFALLEKSAGNFPIVPARP